MKTWKKIVGLTVMAGVALGGLAYFAKKKSLEESFNDEFDDDFDDFDDELDETDSNNSADRNYVPIDLESSDSKADTEEAENNENTENNTETEENIESEESTETENNSDVTEEI